MKHTLCGLLVVFLLAACSSGFTPAGETVLARIADIPVTCVDGSDCAQKWSRASDWVSRNAGYPLRRHSRYLLQTSGPSPSGTAQAVRVTRYARADGVYVFTFAAWCNNGFLCSPGETALKASFVIAVLGEKAVEARLDDAARTDPALQKIVHAHAPLLSH